MANVLTRAAIILSEKVLAWGQGHHATTVALRIQTWDRLTPDQLADVVERVQAVLDEAVGSGRLLSGHDGEESILSVEIARPAATWDPDKGCMVLVEE